MTLADGKLDPDEELAQSVRSLEASRASAAADQPLLAYADQVTSQLRADNWAEVVKAALQARRGAA